MFAFTSLAAHCLIPHTTVSQSQVWSFLGRWWGVAQAAKAVPWSGREYTALSCQISSGIDWLRDYSAQTSSSRRWISDIEPLSREIKGKAVKYLGLQKYLNKLSPKQEQKAKQPNSATMHLCTQHS